jgi:hypothetical protein
VGIALWTPRLVTQLDDGAALVATVATKAPLRVVDVQLHGAVGNGTTDDTSAIEGALAAASAMAPAVVSFPPAVYRITRALRPETDDLTLDGHGATLRLDADVEAILVNKGVYPLTPVNRLRIRGLRIDASAGRGVDSAGLVQLNNAVDFIVTDCTILGPGAALSDGFAFSQGSRGQLARCTVDGVNKSGFYQSSLCGRINHAQSLARNIRGTVGAAGYSIGPGGASLSGCEALDCAGPGILLSAVGASGPAPAQAAADVTIAGGRCSGCLHGLYVTTGETPQPTNISVVGTLLDGNLQWGALLEHGTRIVLSGVNCSRNGYGGARLGQYATRVVLSGGIFAENGSNLIQGIGINVAGQYITIDGGVHFFDEQATPTQLNGVIIDPPADHLEIKLPRIAGQIANPIRYSNPAVTPVADGQYEWTEPTYDPEGLIPAPAGSRVHVLASGKDWKKTSGSGATGWVEE